MGWKSLPRAQFNKNLLASALEEPGKTVSIAQKLDAFDLVAFGWSVMV